MGGLSMLPLVSLRTPRTDETSRSMFVISQASALFLRDGIASVRMTDIAEASGVGVATLYRHYKTKTTLAIHAGTHMWDIFNTRIRHAIDEDEFISMTGAERLTALFTAYIDAYMGLPEFVRFLDEFDHMVLAEGVPSQELEAYGSAIAKFYFLFDDAYQLGLSDGSVTRKVDFPVFYRTVAHSMMAIAQRIVRGDIIPSDDFTHGTDELTCIMRMARYTLGVAEETAGHE